jgi:outer membrane protein OmpU
MLIKARPRLVFFFWIATRGKIMKRILLTTTSLILAAGFASADVSFSGKGEVSYAQAGAADDMALRSGFDLNIAMSGASDNGITYSMGADIGAGDLIDRNDDFAIDAQGADVTIPTMTIAYAGLTITAKQDGIDDLYDDDQNGDIGLSGAMGGLSFAVVADTTSDASSTSFSLSGATGNMTWGFVSTDTNDAPDSSAAQKVTVGYAVSDSLSASFKYDTKGSADAISTFGVTNVMGAITVGLSADDNDDWDASVAYTAGALTASLATDEDSAWELVSEYNLGGGATAFLTTTESEFTALGMSFAF